MTSCAVRVAAVADGGVRATPPGSASSTRHPVGSVSDLLGELPARLARYTLYAAGIPIYVASTWDTGDGWIASMPHIASECAAG